MFPHCVDSAQRLFEPRPGLRERRPRSGPAASQPEIVHSLLAELPEERVAGEPFDLLAEAIRVEPLDRTDELRMKDPAALLQQTAVGDSCVSACVKEYSRSGNRPIS